MSIAWTVENAKPFPARSLIAKVADPRLNSPVAWSESSHEPSSAEDTDAVLSEEDHDSSSFVDAGAHPATFNQAARAINTHRMHHLASKSKGNTTLSLDGRPDVADFAVLRTVGATAWIDC